MYECCGRFYGLLTLFLLLGHSSSHIGKKCNFARICFVRHASCDNDNICRCNPDYPIQISDNKCAKDRRHLEYCTDTKECAMHDKNMYCSLTSSQSRCECHDGFIFNADRQECEPIEENRTSHDILLPMAVGVSVALSSMLCCFLALWRLCNRASNGRGFLGGLRNRRSHSREPRERASAPAHESSWSSDTLPSYDAAVSLKRHPGVAALSPLSCNSPDLRQIIRDVVREKIRKCRVIDKLPLNLERDRATKIDIYTAIALVTASWKATRQSVIVNCFRHAGFKTSDAEDPSNLELPNQEATPSSWEALRQLGHVSEDSSFGDYLRDDADADIQTTEVLDDSEILRLVATGQKHDVEAVEDPVPMPSQVMDAVDLLRRFAGAHEGTAVAFNALTAYEKRVLPLSTKRSQSKITSFFVEQ
ncbi:hypothetical protein HPB47_020600 [Ixodes persulcatus]|uniref:Uncharacterized protein n=1 Tax=Ixodes persulcatus TaxID=34615 RepID=A0AC60QIH3_IXOPE|nr:hypothetical protein HPB47_020600 [Ixodes persulcatus]